MHLIFNYEFSVQDKELPATRSLPMIIPPASQSQERDRNKLLPKSNIPRNGALAFAIKLR